MTKKTARQSESPKTNLGKKIKPEIKKTTPDPSKVKVKRKVTKKHLEKALKAEQEKVTKYKTNLAYLQAEHENFKKSMEKREKHLQLQASRSLVMDLLPVIDDLERAQLMVPRIAANEPFIEGLNMVINNMRTALKSAGVTQIKSEGKNFDPLRHEAVVREETSEYPKNMIIEEFRKGYLLKGALLRPAMVKIAVPPSTSSDGEKRKIKEEAQNLESASDKNKIN